MHGITGIYCANKLSEMGTRYLGFKLDTVIDKGIARRMSGIGRAERTSRP